MKFPVQSFVTEAQLIRISEVKRRQLYSQLRCLKRYYHIKSKIGHWKIFLKKVFFGIILYKKGVCIYIEHRLG